MTNGVSRDGTTPPTRSLLSKHHILYGTERKSHFIYGHKGKKRGFSLPIFMGLIDAQQQISRIKNYGNTGKYVCKVWKIHLQFYVECGFHRAIVCKINN